MLRSKLWMLGVMGCLTSGGWPTLARAAPIDAEAVAEAENAEGRRPADDAELAYWLRNALQFHRYSMDETAAALGMSAGEATAACERLGIDPTHPAAIDTREKLLVLPYPGGRHPRIGFLEGAIRPQRETKVSVFAPWQPADRTRADYVVVDVPEAIWSNLGLTYLAHTHVETIWTKAGAMLPRLEWTRRDDGTLDIERRLPNGIVFAAEVVPHVDHVALTLTLTNGTSDTLTDLRVQNCVMLKAAEGFHQQHNDNKRTVGPYIACRDEAGGRWVLTAWKPNHRAWANAPCPCLHSDPKFDDCPPGETRAVRGWLSFFEGEDVEAEIERIEALNWWKPL